MAMIHVGGVGYGASRAGVSCPYTTKCGSYDDTVPSLEDGAAGARGLRVPISEAYSSRRGVTSSSELELESDEGTANVLVAASRSPSALGVGVAILTYSRW